MTYLLRVKLDKDLNISIGKLGEIEFGKGIYLYVGSAKKGFQDRVRRHLSGSKKIFWHIDYLLSSRFTKIEGVWVSKKNQECQTAGYFLKKGCSFVERFGSSDCRCRSHLFFFDKNSKVIEDPLKQKGFIYSDKSSI